MTGENAAAEKRILRITEVLAAAGVVVGKPDGKGEVMVHCPLHEDKTPSLAVNVVKDVHHCFSCGISGGAAALAKSLGVDTRTMSATAPVAASPAATAAAVKKPEVKLLPLDPATMPKEHPDLGKPVKVWIYRNAEGVPYQAVYRFALPDGDKDIRPLINTQDGGYKWQASPHRLLYRADVIAKNPAMNLYFCEGEKAADACQEIVGEVGIATTWQGGAQGLGKTKKIAEYAAGRHCVLWADNDYAGLQCMLKVADIISPKAARLYWVHPMTGGKGDDAAEAYSAGIDSWEKIKFQSIPPKQEKPKRKPKPAIAETAAPETSSAKPKKQTAKERREAKRADDKLVAAQFAALADDDGIELSREELVKISKRAKVFQSMMRTRRMPPDGVDAGQWRFNHPLAPVPLGYDNTRFYVWSKTASDIFKLPQRMAAVRDLLFAMADEYYYLDCFPKPTENIDYDSSHAVNWIMRECRRRGFFDTEMIRGRGASRDNGGIVTNVGDRLIYSKDGARQEIPIAKQSGFENAYRIGKPLKFNATARAIDETDIGILETAMDDVISWQESNSSRLLIGWLTAAIIGGALDFRPHCWISGASTTGKTWIMRAVIKRVLEGFCMAATSKTTEAGVRAYLGSDSIPVVIDEAESQNPTERLRLQGIIDIARQASSADGGRIVKGVSGGEGVNITDIRSCFLFSSINFGLTDSADLNRFLHLKLRRGKKSEEEWQAAARKVVALTADKDWVDGFRMRAIENGERICELAEAAAQKISTLTGSRREGDLMGTILAAFAVMAGRDLDALIEDTDFEMFSVQDDTDDDGIIKALFGKMVRTAGGEMRLYTAVSLVEKYRANPPLAQDYDEVRKSKDANQALLDFGIQVRDGFVFVSNNTNLTERIFDKTRWGAAWFDTIKHSDYVKERSESRADRRKIAGKMRRNWISVELSYVDNIMATYDGETDDGGEPSEQE